MPRTKKWSTLEAAMRARDPDWDAKVEARREELHRHDAEFEKTLSQIRKELAMTQSEVASALGSEQPQVCRLEKRSDLHVSTLERYLEALGGHLELVGVVGDRRFQIRLGEDALEPLVESKV